MLSGLHREPLFHTARKYHIETKKNFPRLKGEKKFTVNPNSVQQIIDMAGYSKYKKNKKRKNKKGKRKKRIPRTLTTPTKLIRVKASNYITHTSASGALTMTPIQGNSCDDPFLTKGTGQPLGYDQWKSLYKQAIVVGSKVKLTTYNGGTASLVYGISALPESQGTTALTNYEYYREIPGTKSRLLSPDVDHGYLTSQRSTKKMLHRKKLVDDDTVFMDLVNETPPADQWYWHLWFQSTDQSTTVGFIEAVIDVEYLVLLKDPIIPSRSVET